MDKTVFAKVDAHMRVAAAQGIKKNKVTRLQRMTLYRCPDSTDIKRGARQDQAQGFAKDMAHQSAAVKSCFRRFPSAPITYTNEAQGTHRQFLSIDSIALEEGYRLLVNRVIRGNGSGTGG